ncbi:MAG: hypothetical protein ACRELA_11555 [Candidatus Rokuibacteriota bacterium]
MRIVSALGLLVITVVGVGQPAAPPPWRGLVARYPWPQTGVELVPNPGFADADDDGKPDGWSLNTKAWSLATGTGASRPPSLKLTDSHLRGATSIAETTVAAAAGWYTIAGLVRTEGLTRGCVRVQVKHEASGTCHNDAIGWTVSKREMFLLDQPKSLRVQAYGWGKPDGRAWFDDVSLQAHVPPDVEMFLLSPNHLGMLWADGPQTVRVAVRGNGLGHVRLTSVDGATVYAESAVALTDAWTTVTLSSATVPVNGVARVALDVPGANDTPTYQIVKTSKPAIYFDGDQYLIMPDASGQPTKRFAIGVYHTSGYPGTQEGWAKQLGTFFPALPADLYLNYWLGAAPASSLQALGRALAAWGMGYVHTINNKLVPKGAAQEGAPDEAYLGPMLAALADQPGQAGLYIADERNASWLRAIWGIRAYSRGPAPRLWTFIAQNRPDELSLWRDVTDVISVDRYPFYAPAPRPLGETYDNVQALRAAVHDARPVHYVIQYFGHADGFRWPTDDELRAQSWMAIIGGARGLWYWSLGAKGLAYLSETTTPKKSEAWQWLLDIVGEIKSHEAVLIAPPTAPPDVPEGIAAIARRVGNTTHVFTINRTGSPIAEWGVCPDPSCLRFWTSD